MFKSKVLAAAAVVALAAAPAAVAVTAASAATPSCGSTCVNVFSREFGTHKAPAYVWDVFQQGEKTGQPVILFRTSNSDPAEDFTVSFEGLVSDFYQAGLVTSAVNLHYGCSFSAAAGKCGSTVFPDDFAFEVQYAPYGVESGLCAGTAATAASGSKVTLQPCGVSGRTVWITDTQDAAGFKGSYVPLVNGSDTNFSDPYVLTYPGGGAFPADKPRPQLETEQLTGFSGSILPGPGTVDDAQEWGGDFGVLK
jgi:hypothetical protein